MRLVARLGVRVITRDGHSGRGASHGRAHHDSPVGQPRRAANASAVGAVPRLQDADADADKRQHNQEPAQRCDGFVSLPGGHRARLRHRPRRPGTAWFGGIRYGGAGGFVTWSPGHGDAAEAISPASPLTPVKKLVAATQRQPTLVRVSADASVSSDARIT